MMRHVLGIMGVVAASIPLVLSSELVPWLFFFGIVFGPWLGILLLFWKHCVDERRRTGPATMPRPEAMISLPHIGQCDVAAPARNQCQLPSLAGGVTIRRLNPNESWPEVQGTIGRIRAALPFDAIEAAQEDQTQLFKVVDDWSKARLSGVEWKRNAPPFHTMHFTYGVQNQAFKVFLELDEASNFVGIFVYAPISVPAGRCEAICELMMRLNWRLRFGCLQIDHQDGEMRYFHGIDVEGGQLSATMLDNMLGAAGNTFDDAFSLIMRAIYGPESPEEILLEFDERLVLH